MTQAGRRIRRITIERAAITTNDYNEEIPTWASHCEAFADVLFGSGQERREAAQERGSQSATFIVPWTPTLATVTIKDRISFDGAAWDIQGVAPIGLSREIHFTAVRSS